MVAQRALFPDGRWHFQHGPIDIVLGADGRRDVVDEAHACAWQRFSSVLEELIAELPLLRLPVANECLLKGRIARRMWKACEPFRLRFITPMAAVAGAVSQELITCYQREGVERAWVNNGGDIALHLTPGYSVRVGLFADLARLDTDQLRHGITTDGFFDVRHLNPVRGVATSGWRGRSFSLGIADSVTVLAATASMADAAATVIANAVTVADARIERRPACELKDDSDLRDLHVTVDVPELDAETVHLALAAGRSCAQTLRDAGLIWSCVLVCQNIAVSIDESNSNHTARAVNAVPV